MLIDDFIYNLLTLINISVPFDTEYSNGMPDVVKEFGYPFEEHSTTTKDGYGLCLQRIPHGRNGFGVNNKSVLLVHGLGVSGGQWIGYSNKSTGYMLADAGYDVWILETRGTSHSMKMGHNEFDVNSRAYWNFSWHEIGVYDIPAAIDYILDETGNIKLHYVGHSMGCTVFFVALSMAPEYNSKIASASLLAPAVYLQYIEKFRSYLFNEIIITLKKHGIFKLELSGSALQLIIGRLCSMYLLDFICSSLSLIELSSSSRQVGKKRLAAALKFAVDNVSLKQLIHYQQLRDGKIFKMFDYGEANTMIYNEDEPPEYNFTSVEVPILLMYGKKDTVIGEEGVILLSSKLQSLKHKIGLPFTHIDFVYQESLDTKVNKPIIKFMAEYPIY